MKSLKPLDKNFWGWLSGILITLFFVVCTAKIINSYPYPRSIDEPFIFSHAVEMLQTANFDPNWYHYGTLSTYISLVSMIPGFILSSMQGKALKVSDISRNVFPFYSHSEVFLSPRMAFMLFGMITLLLAALIAYKIGKKKIYLLFTVIALIISQSFLELSWEYVNPNIIGACLYTLVAFCVLFYYDDKKFLTNVVLPGLLTGLTISAKYNFGVIILCPIIYILLEIHPLKRKLSWLILLIIVTIFGFILVQPTSVLSLNKFLDDISQEARHYYSAGHLGYDNEPGLSQFIFYINYFVSEFGTVLMAFSALGIYFAFRLNIKKSIVVFLPSFLYIGYMCMQKVNFVRNMLPVLPIISILISFGLVGSIICINKLLEMNIKKENKYKQMAGLITIFFFVMVLIFPLNKFKPLLDNNIESRNSVVKWLNESGYRGHKLLAKKLDIDTKRLATDNIDYFKFGNQSLYENLRPNSVLITPIYGYDSRRITDDQYISNIEKFNSYFDSLTPIFKGGTNILWENYPIQTTHGDPILVVFEINENNIGLIRDLLIEDIQFDYWNTR